ncbi:249_t:CDS:2, partial [Acaulospora morrowiae]
GFTQLEKDSGLTVLNSYLEDKSYIEGYEPSQADVSVFKALNHKVPVSEKFPYAARWYHHIASYSDGFSALPGDAGRTASDYGPDVPAAAEEDDDVDLFGSDEEEVDEEAERQKAERLAAYQQKKAAKPKVIAKSMVTLDVKPWDDTTDLAEMEKCVRSIEMDGLVWGSSKLVPVGYGIKKLQIACVVEDDKVGVDDLEEKITAFEDYVQSIDVASFNKL